MKLTLLLCGLAAGSALAQESHPPTASATSPEPWDSEKVSYALGMNLGRLRRQSQADTHTDLNSFVQGLKDLLTGKPTQLKESEIQPLLDRVGPQGLAGYPEVEQRRLSYALGMRAGLQLRTLHPEADGIVIAQAIHDVLEGRRTKIQESEIQPLLERARVWGTLKQGEKNRTEGKAFLANNAQAAGVTLLPSGLQYRIIRTGAGAIPRTNDMVYVKYRGTFIDGRQFHRHGHFLTRAGGGLKCWQEALQRMRIGSKWQLFAPPELGYGEEGESAYGIGPNATLIYELELLSLAPPDAEIGKGRLGHALEDSDIPDTEEVKP